MKSTIRIVVKYPGAFKEPDRCEVAPDDLVSDLADILQIDLESNWLINPADPDQFIQPEDNLFDTMDDGDTIAVCAKMGHHG